MLHPLHLLAAVLLATIALATPLRAQSMLEGMFNEAIPTLELVVGHRPGAQISTPEQALTYMQVLAQAAPERVRLVKYATSWEGRPLVYAVISSQSNMARIDAVQADLQRPGTGTSPAQLSNVLPVAAALWW